jgi:DNA primase
LSRKKHNLITSILGDSYVVNGESLFRCPKCNHHKNKLSVNYEKNVFKCWVCEYSGTDILRLVKRYGTYGQRDTWLELSGRVEISDFDNLFAPPPPPKEEQRIDLPPEFQTLTSKDLPLAATAARNYLAARGITEQEILKWKIGYCLTGSYANRVIVPSFNSDGYVNYFIARSFSEDWYRYKNPPASKDIVFNDLYVDWDKDIILTEGVFDAIRAGNAVPLLGSSLNERSKLFQRIVSSGADVYVALDSDAEKKALKLINSLLEYDIRVYKINIHPFSDVGEMTREEFQQRKEKADFVQEGDYLLYHALSL